MTLSAYLITAGVTALHLLSCGDPLSAQQDGMKKVTGVVGDALTGKPIPGARVEIPSLGKRTITDEHGLFSISGIPDGMHGWLFGILGYVDWEEQMEVADREHLRVGLMPQPHVLESITVTTDRLAERRRAAGEAVHALTGVELRSIVAANAAEAALRRVTLPVVPCAADDAAGHHVGRCLLSRGARVRPSVYIDDELSPVPLQMLEVYGVDEIHTIEFYSGGRMIRVYTNGFVASGRPIRPWSAIRGWR